MRFSRAGLAVLLLTGCVTALEASPSPPRPLDAPTSFEEAGHTYDCPAQGTVSSPFSIELPAGALVLGPAEREMLAEAARALAEVDTLRVWAVAAADPCASDAEADCRRAWAQADLVHEALRDLGVEDLVGPGVWEDIYSSRCRDQRAASRGKSSYDCSGAHEHDRVTIAVERGPAIEHRSVCEWGARWILDFETDRASLLESSHEVLRETAERIRTRAHIRAVRLTGFGDYCRQGPREDALGLARAQAAAAFMRDQGLASELIQVRAWDGDPSPVQRCVPDQGDGRPHRAVSVAVYSCRCER